MKNRTAPRYLFISLLLSVCINLPAQEHIDRPKKASVVVNRITYEDSGKTKTYLDVSTFEMDKFISAFQARFGESSSSEGVYRWEGLNIDGIGEGLTIDLYDGIWTQNKKSVKYSPEENAETIKLKKNQHRGLRVTVLDNLGEDALQNDETAAAMKHYLLRIVNKM
ncbi:MAG: hypothetical protein KJ607_08550 [Bacteroidetes bacterium]|nr:hypothetical protein [Bacteroidota bacterium]